MGRQYDSKGQGQRREENLEGERRKERRDRFESGERTNEERLI